MYLHPNFSDTACLEQCTSEAQPDREPISAVEVTRPGFWWLAEIDAIRVIACPLLGDRPPKSPNTATRIERRI
jgi:hypothetical protein